MNILFIDRVHPSLKNNLKENNFVCDESYHLSKEEIEKIIHKYEGIIIRSRFQLDKHFLDKATKLKFIARAGSGLENIDTNHAQSRNIKCYNAAEGNRQSVAEHALGMILSLFNNLNKSDKEVRSGIWEREGNRGIELSGKTIGIIGFGNNGSAFAEVLKGFNVSILAFDKYLKKYPYKSSMENIFKKVDIISLHIPLTEETTYLADDKFVNSFKKGIYLINTARGKCANTKSIVKGIKNGKIKGACLDVLEQEKTSFEDISKERFTPELQYLIDSDKTILSPHIAGWTVESNIKVAEILFNKITDSPLSE